MSDVDVKPTVMDLIKFSAEQKPIDFEQAFGDLMVDRMQTAIADRKIEIAASMFNPQYQEDVSDETGSDEVEQEEQIELEDQTDGQTA